MGQITIIKRDGSQIDLFRTEPFCTVSQAVQNFTLMGDDNVQLTIQSAEIMDFSIGNKILIGGDEYSIRTKANREIIGESRFTYEVTFYGVMYDLMRTMYRDTDINGKSSKSTFDLTYSLSDLIKVIIYNLNRDYPGIWGFDAANCPVTEPKTFSFSKQNCLQVLQNTCNEYGYEFRIDLVGGVRTIKIGEFGSVVAPPAGNAFFEWGKGAGLYKLKEQKVDDKSIITRLWVEGGTENIKSGYRNYSDRLQLPMRRLNNHAHTLSNGTVIPAHSEYIGITNDEKRYIEDETLKNNLGSIEDVEQYDIHPTRAGEVTSLGVTIYSFVDSTMDFDLNEKDTNGAKWLIAETSAKITFITGKLAGQQFEMKEYNHSSKTFTIIKNTDERGLSVPTADSEAFRFAVGDKYKITDINLPDAYVDDAEENLWYAGYDDFHLNRKLVRAQYILTFDRSYFINALPADSETSVFRVGDYIPVKDTRFNLEKNIRIQKLSRNLLLEHDYTLTISDITTVPIATQIVQEVLEHEIIIEANRLRDTAKARRAWRTTEELRNLVYDTDGYFNPENIKPNSIDTNMLTVGSKSQQFILIDVVLEANVNGLPNRFDSTAGALIHLTIDENGAKIWNMSAASIMLSENGGYYVFAKCSKSGNQGVFYITQQQLKVEPTDDPNNYYFQVGIIGSLHVDDNYRDFTTTYGFTRINGNTITTGKIVTSDGECYLDLDGNKFRIGDANGSIDWNVTGTKQLTLQNVKVLSKSGDISDIGVFRGNYSSIKTYYPGDEVAFASNGYLSSYRQIHPTDSCSGIDPTNNTFWLIKAKGGESVYYLNMTNDNSSIAAAADGSVPSSSFNLPSAQTEIQLYLGSSSFDTGVTYQKKTGGENGGLFTLASKVLKITSFSSDVASCVIEALVNNVVVASAIFTVTRVKGGQNGESSVIYSLLPSVSTIKRDKDGVAAPTSIACSKLKRIGSTDPAITAEMSLFYTTSTDSTETAYSSAVNVGAWTWIEFILKNGTTVLDRERIPVVKDGQDGATGSSPYQIILSNQMASVVLKADGTLDYADAVTTPTLYNGFNTVPNVTYAITAQSGVVASISNGIVSVTSVTNESTNVEITATLQGGSTPISKVLFKVVKVKSAIAYQIIPSVNAVKKDKSGVYSVSSISFNVYRVVGDVRTQVQNVSEGVKMVIRKDDNPNTARIIDGGTYSTFSNAVMNPSPAVTSVVAKLYVNNPYGLWTDQYLLDIQTVPILVDGSDGVDANMLDWVEDWDSRSTLIDNERVISPKMYSGTKSSVDGSLKGVAFGHEVITIIENGVPVKKTGIIGIRDGVITFILDANTGDVSGNGKFSAGDENGKIVLDPSKKGAILYDSNGLMIGRFSFEETDGIINYSSSRVELYSYVDGVEVKRIRITPDQISMMSNGVLLWSVMQSPTSLGSFSNIHANLPVYPTVPLNNIPTGDLFVDANSSYVVKVKH